MRLAASREAASVRSSSTGRPVRSERASCAARVRSVSVRPGRMTLTPSAEAVSEGARVRLRMPSLGGPVAKLSAVGLAPAPPALLTTRPSLAGAGGDGELGETAVAGELEVAGVIDGVGEQVGDGGVGGSTGVVDEDVRRAEEAGAVIEGGAAAVADGEVCADGGGGDFELFEFGEGGGEADAAAAAGHECNFAGEAAVHGGLPDLGAEQFDEGAGEDGCGGREEGELGELDGGAIADGVDGDAVW